MHNCPSEEEPTLWPLLVSPLFNRSSVSSPLQRTEKALSSPFALPPQASARPTDVNQPKWRFYLPLPTRRSPLPLHAPNTVWLMRRHSTNKRDQPTPTFGFNLNKAKLLTQEFAQILTNSLSTKRNATVENGTGVSLRLEASLSLFPCSLRGPLANRSQGRYQRPQPSGSHEK